MAENPVLGQNPIIKTADEIIQELIENYGLKALEAAQVSAFPPLGWPVISNILDYFEKQEAVVIEKKLVSLIAKGIVQITTDSEDAAYTKAVTDIHAAVAAGDQNALEKASNDFNSALDNLVGWDGG